MHGVNVEMLMYPGLLHPIRVRIWLRTCLHEGCAQKRGLPDPFAASATFSIQLMRGTNHIDGDQAIIFHVLAAARGSNIALEE